MISSHQPSVQSRERLEGIVRRVADVLLAALGLLLSAPLLMGAAAAIIILDGRPVLYVANRVGHHGRVFHLYKFRTMVPAEGSSVTVWADSRVTPIGKTLRQFKLDELPQFFNVLRGDMSIVGPRPEDPSYVALYTDAQRSILDWKPGITSVAALEYWDEAELLKGDDWEKVYRERIMPTKIAMETEYAGRRTLWSDAGVLVRTAFGFFHRIVGGR